MKIKISENHTKKDILILIKEVDRKTYQVYSCDRSDSMKEILKKFR